jgi:hypothetical protein
VNPEFKLGDGKWGLIREKGFEVSKENMLYQVKDVNFDVIHTQHKPITEAIYRLYLIYLNYIQYILEVISLEEPIKHESIKKYVIRDSIANYIQNDFDVS